MPCGGRSAGPRADDQLGESAVTVRVSDVHGAEMTQQFMLRASRSGGPPLITSVPETEASVGPPTSTRWTPATRRAILVFRLLTAPDGMTISETTGEISWTPRAGQTLANNRS